MNIIELHTVDCSNGNLVIELNSSFDLNNSDVALGAKLTQGSAGFLNWSISFVSHNLNVVKVESVLNVKDRSMIKIPHTLGNTFMFKGSMFNAVGKSSQYLVLNKKVDNLKTGSEIEVFGASYKYDINIFDAKKEDIKSVIVTITTGEKVEKREVILNG